ncbi:hypothetical protein EV188_10528 [Actinomycetospora succinea]|uniref:Uncharacterized protein n=2 Tax=Actinomycetospora succinea TaxID=663603 RepID=A0A4R6V8J6_9PSEU|nr:hypothetical protein EV188_10528 [Actinomycetospora succinea]
MTVADGEDSVALGRSLVGDEVTIRDVVAANAEDSTTVPSELDLWKIADLTRTPSRCLPGGPTAVAATELLLEVCPMAGPVRDARWLVHVNLTGASVSESSETPVEFSPGASASWRPTSIAAGQSFWLNVRLPPPVAHFVSSSAGGGVARAAISMSNFSLFFILLLVGLVAIRRSGGAAFLDDRTASMSRTGLWWGSLGLSACSVIVATDIAYALSIDKGPHSEFARSSAVTTLVLVALLGVVSWQQRRVAYAAVGLVLVLCIVAYFGPEVTALETGQTDLARHEYLGFWKTTGYIGNMVLGALVVGVVIFALCGTIARCLSIIAQSESRLDTLLRGRSFRIVLGLLTGIAVAVQWLRVAYMQWEHRILVPEIGATPREIRDVLLGQMPWFVDFLLRWLPLASIYLSLLLAGVLLVVRRRSAPGGSSSLEPRGVEAFLLMIIFSAGLIGIYGSYRGVQAPIAFIVGILSLRFVLAEPRLASEVVKSDPLAVLPERLEEFQVEQLRQSSAATMHNQRGDDLEKRYQKGAISSVGFLFERAVHPLVRQFDRVPPATAAGQRESGRSQLEIAVAVGPRVHWWENALYATKIGAVVAAPVVAYDAYRLYQNGVFAGALTSRSGLFDLLQSAAGELTTWLAGAFALGALWSRVPGRRGFLKGLALGVVVLAASGSDAAVSWAVGQAPFIDFTTFPVLVFGFLATVGLVMDVVTLRKIDRERWELADLLRLRDTRWIATYGATLLIVASSVLHSVQEGLPLTSQLTATVEQAVGSGGGSTGVLGRDGQ